jgi:hypothetical protein
VLTVNSFVAEEEQSHAKKLSLFTIPGLRTGDANMASTTVLTNQTRRNVNYTKKRSMSTEKKKKRSNDLQNTIPILIMSQF